jgi:ABC-type transport system involved in multi-copper enzyme maturation permease subunit
MRFAPVLIRELRVESRRQVNYWLRVVAGGAAICGAWIYLETQQGYSPATLGLKLFGVLNSILFAFIWICVPLMTADCISKEKREGTLGLLFLTALRPWQIVAAKGLAHSLRSILIMVAIFPVMGICFVFGGLTSKDIGLAALLNGTALMLALSAGILASTLCSKWSRAALLSLAFSMLFLLWFSNAHLKLILGIVANMPGGPNWMWRMSIPGDFSFLFFDSPSHWRGSSWAFSLTAWFTKIVSINTHPDVWQIFWTAVPPASQGQYLAAQSGRLGLSFLFFLGVIGVAALRLKSHWQDKPLTLQQLWVLNTFCTPFFWRSLFRSRMSRQLNRNPIGWLQQYSWRARVSRWSWCFGIILVQSILLTDPQLSSLMNGQYILAILLMFGVAFAAANSFREERESGALELLLVTPLSESQIIRGRVLGIWNQFLPAFVALGLAWGFLAKDFSTFVPAWSRQGAWVTTVFPALFICAYVSVPLIGLFFSMQRLHPVSGWIITSCLGIVLPLLALFWEMRLMFQTTPWGAPVFGSHATIFQTVQATIIIQLAGGAAAFLLLYRQLSRRNFTRTIPGSGMTSDGSSSLPA